MRRIDRIEPFRVMQLLERARELEAQGRSIVHMEIGEPDFSSPPAAADAARALLDSGDGSFYTPSTGIPELRSAIARWYGSEYGLTISPERVLVTPGASGGFLALYLALVESGERVLLPDPGYPCQRHFVRLAGGDPVSVPVGPGSRYHLTAEHVAVHGKNGVRAVVVTSPGNPTGTVCPADHLRRLATACRDKGAVLISDEIYHGLTYGVDAPCALSVDPEAVVVNGFSKRWAMTGWRVGWLILPEPLIDPVTRVLQNIFIAPTTLSQHAALAALGADTVVAQMRAAYAERRAFLLTELPKLGFRIPATPDGAFYIYADAGRFTDDAQRFCQTLLEAAGVAITPGADFGTHQADRHVRFSYATSLEQLREGVARLGRYLAE
ncbi:MAG: aminotransferase class I/II-fold pyridoxal phosphate-dependent enzyme [Nitrospirota bacterium]|nr:aminotransferase class I/II-fold pyridoxal phosphate-dependent enzyme [Nitrospirota bacterium]